MVKAEDDYTVKSIPAKGMLNEDSKNFHVVFATSAGQQSYTWNWDWLKEAVDAYRN